MNALKKILRQILYPAWLLLFWTVLIRCEKRQSQPAAQHKGLVEEFNSRIPPEQIALIQWRQWYYDHGGNPGTASTPEMEDVIAGRDTCS